MPIFFVGYTVLVWAFAVRYRRTMAALIPLGGGIAGLMLINVAHYHLSIATDGAIDLPMVQTLMYPYTLLVALGGGYLALLPRRHGRGCVHCGYDLAGLSVGPAGESQCPECGTVQPARNRYRPSGTDPDDASQPNPDGPTGLHQDRVHPRPTSAAEQADQPPSHQHPAGHAAQQDPADQPGLVRR